MGRVIFLTHKPNTVDRQATITKMPTGRFHVRNDMEYHYPGTINEIWSQAQLTYYIQTKRIKYYDK